MDGFPFLLLFFAAFALVIWYASVAQMGKECLVFTLLVLAGFVVLPNDAQFIPWVVLLAAAARSGRLLVIRQTENADR